MCERLCRDCIHDDEDLCNMDYVSPVTGLTMHLRPMEARSCEWACGANAKYNAKNYLKEQ